MKHVQVQTKLDLEEALSSAQHKDADYVVEVESGIDTNDQFHR